MIFIESKSTLDKVRISQQIENLKLILSPKITLTKRQRVVRTDVIELSFMMIPLALSIIQFFLALMKRR